MRFLLDTHLLVWLAVDPDRLSAAVRQLLDDSANEFSFSVASIWEIAIKQNLKKRSFNIDPGILRRDLVDYGYVELPVLGDHALALRSMPLLHHDPFDRILIAQAIAEGITLLTVDALIATYPGSIRRV